MNLEGNYQHAITANPDMVDPVGHLPFNLNPFSTPTPPAHDGLFTAIHHGDQDTSIQAEHPFTNQFDIYGSPILDSIGHGLQANSSSALTRDFLGAGTYILENNDDQFGSEEKENVPPGSIFSSRSARFSTQVSRNNKLIKKRQ